MNFESVIIATLYSSNRDLSAQALAKELNIGRKEMNKLKKHIDNMVRSRIINKTKKGEYYLRDRKKIFPAKITGLSKTYGFLCVNSTNEEMFVRGRDLLGAVPGDEVLAKVIMEKDENNRSQTAAVVAILYGSEMCFTGVIVSEGLKLYCQPDKLGTPPLQIIKTGKNPIHAGDKVTFKLHKRGERHSEHTVDIVSVFGSSDVAKICTYAYLEEQALPIEFPSDVKDEADFLQNRGIKHEETQDRLDLRDLPIFTIDGADTKDIDDAISISKTDEGFNLGVHIADVSYYVKKGSLIDEEAFNRGTSIYIADRVIPMLPPALSNGICSLNPKVDRLAFSCLMKLDESGQIKSFEFRKSLIRSRVQGVYDEINKILEGEDDHELKEKYSEVYTNISVMNKLAVLLQENRKKRGAPEINSTESKIICDADGVCIDIKPRVSGISEGIIEEFMLCANNCAAKLAMEKEFPFVYRIHESPAAEKLIQLHDTLITLGVNAENISEKSKVGDIARLLRDTADDPKTTVINRLVLRTMAKAKYSAEPVGHYGLAMKEYSHFTSPIRRYSDLAIHRILTAYEENPSVDKLKKQFTKFSIKSSLQASQTELSAVNAERACEDFYMAEYMKNHIGEEFDGFISGVIANGIFVQLDNTVEGRIGVESLPVGFYEVQHSVSLVETNSKFAYTIGEKLKVKCVGVNVNSGLINFELISKV